MTNVTKFKRAGNIRLRVQPKQLDAFSTGNEKMLHSQGNTEENAHPDAVRKQAARILNSPAFLRAPRMQRFLSFVIDETLAGRSALLKEYTIAVNVFGK